MADEIRKVRDVEAIKRASMDAWNTLQRRKYEPEIDGRKQHSFRHQRAQNGSMAKHEYAHRGLMIAAVKESQEDPIPLTRREYERELKAEEFRKMMGWPSRITLRRYKS